MSDAKTGLEKIYLNWILDHPEQFQKVEPYFFKNVDIQLVYEVIRNDYLFSKKKLVPSPQQIFAMVRTVDTENKLSDALIKQIIKNDNSNYTDEWVDQRFRSWKISNAARNKVMQSIDHIRGLEDMDLKDTEAVVTKLKVLFSDLSLIEDDDEDLGDDFDDPETHRQDSNIYKIPTGWSCVDNILGGGWDYASLSVFLGETSVGKSMWLHNIAVNAANNGKNVAILTLEMAKHKVMKRVGSMRLKIPASEYEERSKDLVYMKNKINSLKNPNGGLFNANQGKIFVKKFATSTCTITDIDNFVKKFEERKKIKLDIICLDYINLMALEKGMDFNSAMLYLKGKHLAEGLRYIADKYNIAVITATQTDKAVWGANDIKLNDIPESKAIAETADTVWGIIRNPEMKRSNLYRLKILKLRDGENKEEQVKFDFNTTFLTMENDQMYGAK